jgi:hypothetical protein
MRRSGRTNPSSAERRSGVAKQLGDEDQGAAGTKCNIYGERQMQ